MVGRISPRQQRLLSGFGANLPRWRAANCLTATGLAAGTLATRKTLRHIESGTGTARFDSALAVLISLGIAEAIVKAADPYRSDAARAQIDANFGEEGPV